MWRSWDSAFISTMILSVSETDSPSEAGYGSPKGHQRALSRRKSTDLHWEVLQRCLRCHEGVAHRVVTHNRGKNLLQTTEILAMAFMNGQCRQSPGGDVTDHPVAICGLCLFSPVDGHPADVFTLTLSHMASGVHVDNLMAAHASLEPSCLSLHVRVWRELCLSVQDQWQARIEADISAYDEARQLLAKGLSPNRISSEVRKHLLRVGGQLSCDGKQPILVCANTGRAAGCQVSRYLSGYPPSGYAMGIIISDETGARVKEGDEGLRVHGLREATALHHGPSGARPHP